LIYVKSINKKNLTDSKDFAKLNTEMNTEMKKANFSLSDLISHKEAANILKVSRQTIHAMVKRGDLHPILVSDRRYLTRYEVEKLASERDKKK